MVQTFEMANRPGRDAEQLPSGRVGRILDQMGTAIHLASQGAGLTGAIYSEDDCVAVSSWQGGADRSVVGDGRARRR